MENLRPRAYRKLSQILTLDLAWQKDGRRLQLADLSPLDNASVVFNDQEILWVGPDGDFPEIFKNAPSRDLPGRVLIPEIVDSHTHLVFGGDRSREFSLRLSGATYEDIAKQGGGILNTMRATGAMERDQLWSLAVERIERISSYGVGTLEIKSGYGLSYNKELELSHLIHDLKNHFRGRVRILNTYMSAHAIPPTFSSSSDYMDKVVLPLLHHLGPQKILDAVDIFYERNYFDRNDVLRLFQAAKHYGLSVKMHADEFENSHGALLAVEQGALSADHLLQTDEEGIKALAGSSTVATFLPGTGLFLGKKLAVARSFLDQGVKVALASDYNPGSCHCDNILLVASLAAPQLKMNLAEVWAAVTLNGAAALGIKNQGAIRKGLLPRFSLFRATHHEQIPYHWGRNLAEPCPVILPGV